MHLDLNLVINLLNKKAATAGHSLLALTAILAALVGILNNPEIMEKLQPSSRELSSLPESDFYQPSIKY